MKTQLLHDNYSINEKGHFTVCGHDTVELAKQYVKEGASASTAAKQAASETGFKKGDIYKSII